MTYSSMEAYNSKYDYEDVSYFLAIVYNSIIYAWNDECRKDDLQIINTFIEEIIIKQLDSCQVEDAMRVTAAKNSKNIKLKKIYKARPELGEPSHLLLPSKDLIMWIKKINKIGDLTLVKILDDFFQTFPVSQTDK